MVYPVSTLIIVVLGFKKTNILALVASFYDAVIIMK